MFVMMYTENVETAERFNKLPYNGSRGMGIL